MAGSKSVQGADVPPAMPAVGGGLCAAPREAKRLPYEFSRYNTTPSIITVGDGSPVPARRAGFQCVQGTMRIVTTFAARVGGADGLFVQGALRVVTTFAAR